MKPRKKSDSRRLRVGRLPHSSLDSKRFMRRADSERMFQGLLESAPDAIVIVDKSGHILLVNSQAEKMFGYKREELLSQSVEILLSEHLRNRHVKHRAGYHAEPHTRPMGMGLDLVARKKDGTEFPVEISLSPMEAADGILVTSIIRDITERKKVQDEIRKLNQELEQRMISSERLITLGEMAASLAHEFNNPLGIIMGFAQDLLTEVPPEDQKYSSLMIIEEEARRCKKIMRDLLEFGRPTPAQFMEVDPGEIIRKSLDLVSSQLEKGKVRIGLDLQQPLPKIRADPQQIQQVLVNLFFNAKEAMLQGGVLTVRAMTREVHIDAATDKDLGACHEVVFSVMDTGTGIDPKDLPKIFRPFFSTKKSKGIGLGLSICESIMKTHGGKITIESNPGKGTIFYLHFPTGQRRHIRHEI